MATVSSGTGTTRRKASRRALELQCPECTGLIKVAARDLIEGTEIACPHCECEAEVAQDFDDKTGKTRWMLVDPFADYGDDDARR